MKEGFNRPLKFEMRYSGRWKKNLIDLLGNEDDVGRVSWSFFELR
jgi:hypothetical protein